MRSVARAVCIAAIAVLMIAGVTAQSRAPRLIVLLMVDQMRGDYVDKFQQQWTHGLHRLVTAGAWFRQADYPYFDTVTCAGHASVSTGSVPATHGMILNRWWDRDTKAEVNCTDDDSVTDLSYGKPIDGGGESAARLRTSTLADELRAQLSPAGHVIAFSLKARSAVMLGGQRPDAVAWFDDSGTWVTSTAFTKAPVPEVADFIRRNPVENDFGKAWDRTLPESAYLYESPATGIRVAKGMTKAFPHLLKGGSSSPDATFYDQWQSSPYADEYLGRMALDVAGALHFEKTGRTNLIAISFSTLDKVGHDFGPNSHEIQDVLVRLDRTLGDFFSGLDRLVGAGNYTVALSADHGVSPIPERAAADGLDAGRVSSSAVTGAIDDALRRSLGVERSVARFMNPDIYLEPGVFDRMIASPAAVAAVQRALKAVPGVLEVYTRDRVAANQYDDDPIGRRLAHSYYPGRSGDLTVLLKPYWLLGGGAGTSHGTPYAFDTRVPVLLMGKGIAPGEYLAPASPTDVAPTLAFLAGVTLPRAQGRVLSEALAPARAGSPGSVKLVSQ
jgi:predicted AlkP superfamily pyrophosphatase or phosphodiesterase